ENWEVFVASVEGGDLVRLTSDDQHDLFPTFLSPSSILVIKGEGRHRRSYVYDLETRRPQRLFHNNTIRTVSPEYTWAVSPNGSMVAIVSERDGDTISPERSLHVVDLGQVLPIEKVQERLGAQLAAEQQLREDGARAFQPIAADVKAVVADVSRTRIYEYERDLFAFGSKFITQPGNGLAIRYIADKLRSFGYEPELQWFEPRSGIQSANIIATLPGTLDPHLVYVISSHFDSVERGPGADDNTSGTTALLEAARVLKDHPMPRTIQFAFFTGEEAGLLGSRHFVREAVTNDVQLLGALNNDMVGYANDARLDNTIRYSNAGIRDIQHAAAFLFTDLVTYDAKYYKSTDAHSYYEAYGDIVGGIGSYPILANPHYHQTHDVLETINHQLVAEVSKTTVATIMFMASGTARLESVTADRSGSDVTVAWSEPLESGIANYVLFVWDESGEVEQVQVYKPEDPEFAPRSATLSGVSPGATVGVKAWVHGANGVIGSWDWARAIVP
ncbi:MAG: M20/M25/M40 family metallo-hydrolase, partial [Gemmatimonadales bacterium]